MMVFLKLIMLCTTSPGVLLTMKPMTIPSHTGHQPGARSETGKEELAEKERDEGLVDSLYPSRLEVVGDPEGENEQQQHQQQRSRRPELLDLHEKAW